MEKKVYNGQFVQVTEEEIQGSLYERVYIRNAMTIFPVDDKKRILFIKEKRLHETPPVRWKPVTGYFEEGQSLEENANRELQEEIGKKAGSITPFFSMHITGTINIVQKFVIARDLQDSKVPNPDGEDTILEIAALDLEEILDRTLGGEFAKGSVGYGLLKLYYEVKNGTISL
jgi:8-oxo-dGTP pyrophosphatase MutT (NUDIX family)